MSERIICSGAIFLCKFMLNQNKGICGINFGSNLIGFIQGSMRMDT